MMNNNLYNLMMQLTVEHKSLWRIKGDYMRDAEGSPESKAYWEKNISEKEEHIKDLTELIKKELK